MVFDCTQEFAVLNLWHKELSAFWCWSLDGPTYYGVQCIRFLNIDFLMVRISFLLQKIDFQELSTDDYFLKNNEFSMWLKEEKDVFFSDLSSESARQLFADFVKVWNKQKLESKYYEGIASGPRCAHAWKIKGWNARAVGDPALPVLCWFSVRFSVYRGMVLVWLNITNI